MEIVKEKITNQTVLQSSGITIRIEDVLSGKKLDNLIKNSDEIADYYIENLVRRLESLYTYYNEIDDDKNAKELAEYYYVMSLTTKKFEELEDYEKVKLFKVYDTALKNQIYGPYEIYDRKVNQRESFSLEDMFYDRDILKTVQDAIPSLYEGPDKIAVQKKMNEFNSVIENLSSCKEERLCFAVNREILLKNYSKVKKILEYAREHSDKQIELVIDDNGMVFVDNSFDMKVPYSYTQSEMQKFTELIYLELIDNLYFSEFYQEPFIPTKREELWSYYDVYRANANKKNIVKSIQRAKLSPFETILMANGKISESKYVGHASSDEKTRTFLTAEDARDNEEELKKSGKAFVCTGYSSYAKAIIDELNNENLKCMFVPANFHYGKTKRRKYGATHMMLLVKIKDEKYDIDGYYMWDPTWSNIVPETVLFPIEDIKKYSKIYADINHRKISKISSFLLTERSHEKDEDKVDNTVYDDYAGKSKPINFHTMITALDEMYSKLRNSKYNDAKIAYLSNQQLISELITKTMRNTTVFNTKNSQNKFYVELRNYFIENSDKFLDWENKWNDYIKDIIFS